MSIAQNEFAFGAPAFHSRAITSPRFPRVRTFAWWGLAGEAHITSPPAGQDVTVECVWEAASFIAARGLIVACEARTGRLFGDLSVQQAGGELETLPQCTFVGVAHEPIRYDPHRGWWTNGVLRWRQRVAPVPGGA